MVSILMAISVGALIWLSPPALAQHVEEEIVVTGSRRARYEGWAAPQVFIMRRADFAIAELEISSDTRDGSARGEELAQALRRLDASARRAGMTLALVDDDIGLVRPFSLEAAERLIRPGRRADTSRLSVRLRTPVSAEDTLENLGAPPEAQQRSAPQARGAEMELGGTDLSMVNLQQHRPHMLARIVQEARELSQLLGGAQSVEIGGLASQVAFQRTGDLELVLFLPYEL